LEEALAAGREAYAFSTLVDGDELFVVIDQLPIDILQRAKEYSITIQYN
jgi:hypothetical protein